MSKNTLIGENGLIGTNGLTDESNNINLNTLLTSDELSTVSEYVQNNMQTLQANAIDYKFMRVSHEGLSVSDQPEQNTFSPVVQVKKSFIIFDKIFNIVIGNELLQNFIIRIFNTFLSKWIVLSEDGHVIIKGIATFNENINADKMIISKGGIVDGDV